MTHRKWDAPRADLQLQCHFPRLKKRQQLHQSSNSKQDFELLEILEQCWKFSNSILTKRPTRRRLYMILHKSQADQRIPKAHLSTSFLWWEEFSTILREAHITTRISYQMGDTHRWMLPNNGQVLFERASKPFLQHWSWPVLLPRSI